MIIHVIFRDLYREVLVYESQYRDGSTRLKRASFIGRILFSLGMTFWEFAQLH